MTVEPTVSIDRATVRQIERGPVFHIQLQNAALIAGPEMSEVSLLHQAALASDGGFAAASAGGRGPLGPAAAPAPFSARLASDHRPSIGRPPRSAARVLPFSAITRCRIRS